MKRWTRLHEIGFHCVVVSYSIVLIVPAVLLSPLLFVPGLWDGYSAWSNEDE